MQKKFFLEHSLKWIFAFACVLVLTFAFGRDMKVYADTETTISFDKTYSGTTSNGGINKYYFELPSAGRITINLNTTSWLGWEFLDSSYSKIDNAGKTGTSRISYDLVSGKYEFDIMKDYNNNSSDYTLSIHFDSANETYTYSNNTYIDVTSQPGIPFSEKITGQLAVNDTMDYYKLVMPFTGTVQFSLLADQNLMNYHEVKFTIRNSKDEILNFAYFKDTGLNQSYTLEKGTYYLCFSQVYNSTGNYYFVASCEMDTPTNVAVKASSATALKVTATKRGDITGYNIRYRKDSGAWKTVTVKGNKNLSKSITGLVPGTYKVQVRAYCTASGVNYYSSWSTTQSVSCKPSAPTSVKVTNTSANTLKITAKKSGNITGFSIRYKKDSGAWKTVTVKGNKKLSKSINKLTKGSTYKVQVRTYLTVSGKKYYSSWSTAKSIKINK